MTIIASDTEMTLPEVQQLARTQVIDLRGVQIGKLGFKQSSRLPMTVVDDSGKQRRGVFTKASSVNVLGPVRQTLREAADACADPRAKQQIENLIGAYRNFIRKNNIPLPGSIRAESASDEMIVGKMMQDLMWKNWKGGVNQMLQTIGVNVNALPQAAQKILTSGLQKHSEDPSLWVNGLELGLKDGDRLDQRNSAMSAVAGLLGVPKLVARSNNMKYLDENGNEVEGTFMEFAEGLDLGGADGEKLFSQVSDHPFQQGTNLNKDLADMQVLDYICGNIDRHAGNLFYKVDEKTGKITGVQGIDNDSAFGLFSPGSNGASLHLKGTNSLGVISEDMAKRISNIPPCVLKFTLRGRGLTDQEIDAACARLNDLKVAVRQASVVKDAASLQKNGQGLSIMSSKALSETSINTITRSGKNNLFTAVQGKVATQLVYARKQGIAYNPQAAKEKKAPNLKEVGTTSRRFNVNAIGESLRGMSRMIRDEVTGFNVSGLSKFLRSSGKFRSMVSAVKKADKLSAKCMEEIAKSKTGLLDRDDPKVKNLREKADRAMEDVRKTTEAYLKNKMRQRHAKSLDKLVGKSDYEQKRIDYAKNLLEKVKAYEAVAKPDKPEAQSEKEAFKEAAEIRAQKKVKKAGGDAPALGM